jgi:inner membrane protein
MLLLGHTGITLGVAVAVESLRTPRTSFAAARAAFTPRRLADAFVSLSHRVDLRLLLVGSLLPDIIDKPVGLLLFPDLFGTGRLFCHTLLFCLLLAVLGVWRYRLRRTSGLLVLSYGCAMHLLLDGMWRTPETLLWPTMGLVLREEIHDHWLRTIFFELFSRPEAYLPEIAGAMILAPLSLVLLRRGSLSRFLRTGIVG